MLETTHNLLSLVLYINNKFKKYFEAMTKKYSTHKEVTLYIFFYTNFFNIFSKTKTKK